MLKHIAKFARHLADKHPLLDAAIVAVGAGAVVEGVYHTFFKPKASTAQSTTNAPTTNGGT